MNPLDNIRITENFTLGEFYVSAKHPEVAARMPRTMDDAISITRLCALVVQPIRNFLGKAVTVGSGKRNDELNELVDGSDTSQHCHAEAADLEIKGDDTWRAFHFVADELKGVIGQCIIYLDEHLNPEFLHVSTRSLKGSTKVQGDFRVKLAGNPKYFRYGFDKIPGVS